MLTNSSIEIPPGDVAQIVESVFGTMLGLEVSQGGTPSCPDLNQLTSGVHLTGAWNGALLVDCGAEQACRFAGRLLSMDPPGRVDDDVRDALAELANMIGGNLKCLLPSGIQLGIPSVVDGGAYHFRIPGTEVLERMAFQCADGSFWITVLRGRTEDADVARQLV